MNNHDQRYVSSQKIPSCFFPCPCYDGIIRRKNINCDVESLCIHTNHQILLFTMLVPQSCRGQCWGNHFILVKGVGWLHDFRWIIFLNRDQLGNFVSLNFKFLLVLNHDEKTWDCSKGKVRKEKKQFLYT
jgi:hypothetical protein